MNLYKEAQWYIILTVNVQKTYQSTNSSPMLYVTTKEDILWSIGKGKKTKTKQKALEPKSGYLHPIY